MKTYKILKESIELTRRLQRPDEGNLIVRKPNSKLYNKSQRTTVKSFTGRTKGMKYIGHDKDTHHAIMKDDEGNYVRIDSLGLSTIHSK